MYQGFAWMTKNTLVGKNLSLTFILASYPVTFCGFLWAHLCLEWLLLRKIASLLLPSLPKEIQVLIFQMDSSKGMGFDGFCVRFFQKDRPTIGIDIT